jgi:hypothetical protein
MTSPAHQEVHVGIDVSKRTLDVCIVCAGDPRGDSFVVANDQGASTRSSPASRKRAPDWSSWRPPDATSAPPPPP